MTFGCSSPVPTVSPASLQPAATRAATEEQDTDSHEPTATAHALTHFDARGFSFDYPASWLIIVEDWFVDPIYTVVVLGTGEWDDSCEDLSGGLACTNLDPGEFAISMTQQIGGPQIPVYPTPPFESKVVDSGLATVVEDALTTVLATVYAPGNLPLEMNAQLGGSESDESVRAALMQLLDSLSTSSVPSLVALRTWRPPTGQECARLSRSGRLSRESSGGMDLGDPDYASLVWPSGWTTRLADDGRIDMLDSNGSEVAREWDEVEIGGRGDFDEFQVCPDDVAVIRSF